MSEIFKNQIIIIIGPTGVGKTKLSIELAQHYNGEIINCDVLQMYKGLDIITNKATIEERQNITHHMMSFLEPYQKYNVHEYVKESLNIVKNIIERNKVPIFVGGTNLYIEGILYELFCAKNIDNDLIYSKNENSNNIIHFNDKYRIKKNLNIHHIMKNHKMKLRFPNHCIVYLTCSDTFVYENRIIKRSKEMLFNKKQLSNDENKIFLNKEHLSLDVNKQNIKEEKIIIEQEIKEEIKVKEGLKELFEFYDNCLDKNQDFEIGIGKAIGVKEFKILHQKQPDFIKSKDFKNLLFLECQQKFIVNTIKYAKKQNRLIKNRFLKDSNLNIIQLDTLNVFQWEKNVKIPCIVFINNFVDNKNCNEYNSKYKLWNCNVDKEKVRICNSCNNIQIYGMSQWTNHLKSRKHRRYLKKSKIIKSIHANDPKQF